MNSFVKIIEEGTGENFFEISQNAINNFELMYTKGEKRLIAFIKNVYLNEKRKVNLDMYRFAAYNSSIKSWDYCDLFVEKYSFLSNKFRLGIEYEGKIISSFDHGLVVGISKCIKLKVNSFIHNYEIYDFETLKLASFNSKNTMKIITDQCMRSTHQMVYPIKNKI